MAGPPKKRAQIEGSCLFKDNVASGAVLAKYGDVILELSKDGKSVGTLLVSSHVLSLASPVFGAMFSGNFAEGQNLSTASPKNIALPDDDAESMTLFCKLIHMQTANLTREPSFDDLADLAIICDKYGCTESIRSWLQVWISQKLKSPRALKFEKLVFVTYVCDLPRDFQQVTLVLLRDTIKRFSNTDVTHRSNFVPMELIDKLQSQSASLQASVRSQLFGKKYQDLVSSNCPNAAVILKQYLQALTTSGVTASTRQSMEEYVQAGAILKTLLLDPKCQHHMSCSVTATKDIKAETVEALLKASDTVKGLCLDCTRKEHLRNSSIVCRLGHKVTPVHAASSATTTI